MAPNMALRLRLVISGSLGTNGAERWSCGLNFMAPGSVIPADEASMNTWLANIQTYLASLPIGSAARVDMGPAAQVNQLDAYAYDVSGPATIVAQRRSTGMMVGAGTHRQAFQVSRTITLQTATGGRSGRGRVYWPALGATVTDTGTSNVPTSTADSWRDMFAAFEAAWPGTPAIVLAVWSPTQGVVRPLTSIRIGNVLDTQRRRTDKLLESYTSSPL